MEIRIGEVAYLTIEEREYENLISLSDNELKVIAENEESPLTKRCIIANMGKFPEIFVKDEEEILRRILAYNGLCVDELVTDEEISVRYEIAKNGYHCDILSKDEASIVRNEALKHIELPLNKKAEKIREELLSLIENNTDVRIECATKNVVSFKIMDFNFIEWEERNYDNPERIEKLQKFIRKIDKKDYRNIKIDNLTISYNYASCED